MKQVSALAAAALAMIVPAAQPVRADVEVVQTTTISAPGIKQMLGEIPQEQRSSMEQLVSPMLTGTPWVTTTYMKGSKMRTDMGMTSVMVNTASGHQVTMNRQLRSYSIGPYDPFQKSAGSMTVRIAPSGRSMTMLGHTINQYLISMTSSILPKSTISGDLWAAPDLPAPPAQGYANGIAAAFESEMAKVKGMPLAYRLTYRNTPAGDITITSQATQIVDTPIMASTFQIPSDYHRGKVQTATALPSAGFPLGDGMPLDSMTAVTDEIAGGQVGQNAAGAAGAQQMLAGMSPAALQQLLSGMTGSQSGYGGGTSALQGLSPNALSGLLNGLTAGGGGQSSSAGVGDLSSLLNPQMLQQLTSELQSLTDDQ